MCFIDVLFIHSIICSFDSLAQFTVDGNVFLLQYFWFLLRSDILVLANYTHMSDSFKLISLNVRGISNFQKRRMIFTWCRKKSADIVFLQETHSKKETELQWKSEWGSEIMLSHGSSNSRGVAILLKRGVDFCIRSKILDPLGRFIILKAEIADTTYVLIVLF